MSEEIKIPSQELRNLASSISGAIDKYEVASSGQDRNAALNEIRSTAQRLQDATTSPIDRFFDFNLQPMSQACARIAIELGVFEHLPSTFEKAISVETLSRLIETESELTARIVRGLVAFRIINQDEQGLCWHTPVSALYTNDSLRDWATWIFEGTVKGATNGISLYFDSKPFTRQCDPQRTPFTLGHGHPGKNVFEVVQELGLTSLLNSAMLGSSNACAEEAIASFDFASLEPGDGGVVLVDVGGAKGATLQALRKTGLRGKAVLQDLESVLADGTVEGIEAEVMPYDFFKQEQPVKGAAVYYYQRIFHDWDDAHCEKILASLRPSLSRSSRLLICDVVVQDRDPHPRKVLRDLNMLIVGGRERSQKEWESLLERGGFALVAYHGLNNVNNSIVESRLK